MPRGRSATGRSSLTVQRGRYLSSLPQDGPRAQPQTDPAVHCSDAPGGATSRRCSRTFPTYCFPSGRCRLSESIALQTSMAVTPAISSAVGTNSTMAKRGRCSSARLLVGLLFGPARQDHESSVAGHRQGFEVQVEPVVVLVGHRAPTSVQTASSFSPCTKNRGWLGRLGLRSFVVKGISRWFRQLRLSWPVGFPRGHGAQEAPWQRRVRPRGPWGRRLDALPSAALGPYPTDTWSHRSAGLDGSGLP